MGKKNSKKNKFRFSRKSMFDFSGGKMFANGGFGCVFNPPLRCKGSETRKKHFISKLMTTRHADNEYNELTSIKNKLHDIPNFKNYFLLNGISKCSPEKLTEKDVENIKKCKPLKSAIQSIQQRSMSISEDELNLSNINSPGILSKLAILTMPFGGKPVDDFIEENASNIKNLLAMNKAMVHLYYHGILPMNARHVYHSDIKASNILVHFTRSSTSSSSSSITNKNKMYIRLIDWGLSCSYDPRIDTIPRVWKNRPLQFNLPFSIVLFSDFFANSYLKWSQEKKISSKDFIIKFLNDYLNERGKGHYDSILIILSIVFFDAKHLQEPDQPNKNDRFHAVIVHYLSYIIDKFTNTFSLHDYINTMYIHLVDKWGFFMGYLTILEMLFKIYPMHNKPQRQLFHHLQNMYKDNLYTPMIVPKDKKVFLKQLQEMNQLIKNVTSIV